MEFQHTDKVKDLLERVTKFMDDHVYEGEKSVRGSNDRI